MGNTNFLGYVWGVRFQKSVSAGVNGKHISLITFRGNTDPYGYMCREHASLGICVRKHAYHCDTGVKEILPLLTYKATEKLSLVICHLIR